MKRFLWTGMVLLCTGPLPAGTSVSVADTTSTLHFSTKPGASYAWELTGGNNQWTLSFAPGAVVVDNSDPTDAGLQGDFVQLPTMSISGITNRGDFLTATLSPGQSMTISSHTNNAAVLTALMKSGGMLAIGTNTVAYSQQDNDLQIESFNKNYGVIIPALAGTQGQGLMLDLSFSGDAIRGGNLFTTLQGKSGTIRGTLSGQISAISVVPEPATLVLLGLGAALAFRFRPRVRR